jgi:hypothetical protein
MSVIGLTPTTATFVAEVAIVIRGGIYAGDTVYSAALGKTSSSDPKLEHLNSMTTSQLKGFMKIKSRPFKRRTRSFIQRLRMSQ